MSAPIVQAVFMPMSMRRIILLLCATLCAIPAQADPWYRIELLVFTRSVASGSESWPGNPGTPDWSRARPLQPELTRHMYGLTGNQSSPPYKLLPASQFQLKQPANYLASSGGRFETLLHLAWQQPVPAREKAPWLYLRTPATLPAVDAGSAVPRLEGLIQIGLSRYLHLNLDLLQHRPALPGTTTGGDDFLLAPRYRSYRFQAHRRMRSGEIHYLDHPLMGALVQITPVDTTPQTSEAAAMDAKDTEEAAEEPLESEAGASDEATD